jgi:hypothetical protein
MQERIELAIIEISTIKLAIEEKMKDRIVKNSSVKDIATNLSFWNYIEPKFKWWNRSKNTTDHINDLNLIDAYNRSIIKMSEILIETAKKQQS